MIGIESAILPGTISESSPGRSSLFPYRRQPGASALHDYEKILVERAYARVPEMRIAIARLPMVYGPGGPQHRWMPYVAPHARGSRCDRVG